MMENNNNVKAYEKALEEFLIAMKALEEDGIKTDVSIHQEGHGGLHKEVSEINNKLFTKYFKSSKTTFNEK